MKDMEPWRQSALSPGVKGGGHSVEVTAEGI